MSQPATPQSQEEAQTSQTQTPQPMKIDFVSDVVCPWCVIGLGGLTEALAKVGDLVQAKIHFQPFELNPDMPPEGQDIGEHVAQKYGASPEQSAKNREMIRQRAADVGFEMAMKPGSRIYNTFDAHRLLHWAELDGKQAALKMALFEAYFTAGENLSDVKVLIDAATTAGLDADKAKAILESDAYAKEVREVEAYWRRNGISAVPAIIFNDRYVISGGQPAQAFEKAIRSIAAEMMAFGVDA